MPANLDDSYAGPSPLTFRPEAFFPVFERLPRKKEIVVCGDQAVNLLAALFLSQEELDGILGEKGSATSADMDIVISSELQQWFDSSSGQKSRKFRLKRFPDARQPIRFAILPDGMPDTRIDVLRNIRGIDVKRDRVFEDALEIDAPCRVMNPVTLLIAKAENCGTLDQDTPTGRRNDLLHLRMLVPIVRNFFAEYLANCDPESKEDQRDIVNQLKKLGKAATTNSFVRGFQTAGVRFLDAVPVTEIRGSSLDLLRRYLENTFLCGLGE